jgi:hypothetical protein
MKNAKRNPLGLLCDLVTPCIPKPLLQRFLEGFNRNSKFRDRVGYHVRPYHFACPISNPLEVNTAKLSERQQLGTSLLDYATILPFTEQLHAFAKELHHFPVESDGQSPYWFKNFAYDAYDASILHGLIRFLKPRRIIEAGSGFSSMIMTTSANLNLQEGNPIDVLHIEPYPSKRLLEYPLAGTLLQKKIQDVDLSVFRELAPNDILFIDSSHVLKTQSDLVYIFNYILPILPSGVYIHFHDIFTPYDATPFMLFEMQWSWNEQYAIEAILANSDRFEVIVPSYALYKENPNLLKKFIPWETAIPKGFWIRIK